MLANGSVAITEYDAINDDLNNRNVSDSMNENITNGEQSVSEIEVTTNDIVNQLQWTNEQDEADDLPTILIDGSMEIENGTQSGS